jgi:hypothetical protein
MPVMVRCFPVMKTRPPGKAAACDAMRPDMTPFAYRIQTAVVPLPKPDNGGSGKRPVMLYYPVRVH